MTEAAIEAVGVRKQPQSFSRQRFYTIGFSDVHVEIAGMSGIHVPGTPATDATITRIHVTVFRVFIAHVRSC